MGERPYSELLDKLRNQVGFLERSSAAFDTGHKEEGERLALASRVLLHDTNRSHSLLGQLGIKAALHYTDTSLHVRSETKHLGGGRYSVTRTAHAGLVTMRAEPGGAWTYAAPLAPPVLASTGSERINPPASFANWWENPFLTDTAGRPVTRKGVTLAVANKDGGAHVAKAIDEAYHQLSGGESLGIRTGSDDQWFSIPSVVMATMRQIAYELLVTLRRDVPHFIAQTPLGPTVVLTDVEKAAVPRNERCLCGSGKMFKDCHGS